MICTSRGLVKVVKRTRLKTIRWLVFYSSKILNFERRVLLFSSFFFLWKIPNIYVSVEQRNCHKITSLGELNAMELKQNIIEVFVVRVYFGYFKDNSFSAQGCF